MKIRYIVELRYKCNTPTKETFRNLNLKTFEEEKKAENDLKNELTASAEKHLTKIDPCGTNGCLIVTLWKEKKGKKTKVCKIYPKLTD